MPVTFVSTNVLPAVRADVGLVQRRGVHDRVHARRRSAARTPRSAIEPTALVCGGGEHVEPDDVVPFGAQDADERLAEMARAAGDEDPHAAYA